MTTKLYRLQPDSLTLVSAEAMRLSENEMERRYGKPAVIRPDAEDLRRIVARRHCSVGEARQIWSRDR